MAQVLEAVRAHDDGVLTDIREGDVGAILGWGFAPWSGGPFGWLDILGQARAVDICDDLTARFGARFTAPQSLRDMAASGASFYPAPAAKAAWTPRGARAPSHAALALALVAPGLAASGEAASRIRSSMNRLSNCGRPVTPAAIDRIGLRFHRAFGCRAQGCDFGGGHALDRKQRHIALRRGQTPFVKAFRQKFGESACGPAQAGFGMVALAQHQKQRIGPQPQPGQQPDRCPHLIISRNCQASGDARSPNRDDKISKMNTAAQITCTASSSPTPMAPRVSVAQKPARHLAHSPPLCRLARPPPWCPVHDFRHAHRPADIPPIRCNAEGRLLPQCRCARR